MIQKIPVVAIVGRTNVGKSTLFNQLLGRRMAVVEDVAGVTRDRNYALVDRFDAPFTLVDTGGLLGEEESELHGSVREQAELAIREADLVIALLDGLHGLHALDYGVADILRRSAKPVLWVVNKCEKPIAQIEAAEFYKLGIDEFSCVSAAHNVGITELYLAISSKLELDSFEDCDSSISGVETDLLDHASRSIRVAIVGKPNVGKSTLINKITGSDRLVTSGIPGTTRDSIDIVLKRDGTDFTLVDTAGLRRKSKVSGVSPERYGNLRTLKALAQCDVAVLLLDATEGAPKEQDAKIASVIHERGRGLVIVVNKWDAVEKDHKSVKDFERTIQDEFPFARYAPIVFVSALSGRRCPNVLKKAEEVFKQAQVRIATPKINSFLSRAFDKKPPPRHRGSLVKLYYATQVNVAPPTFTLFVNYPREVRLSYQRYLKNAIRKEFGFGGNDIRLFFRKRSDTRDPSLKVD